MISVNVPKVRGKMAEKGYNISTLSAELGIGRGTLSSYFERPERMPCGMIGKMSEILCDSSSEAISLFFVDSLHMRK